MPRWHRVRLDDGGVGFVSKRWTEVVPDLPVAAAPEFEVHFLDVGVGDSAVIDMGTREIVIDGGDFERVLPEYAGGGKIIDPPIELVIVTHGDSDHWKGLARLLGFDGRIDDPPAVEEFWEPGYDRSCQSEDHPLRESYLRFIEDMREIVPPGGFRRPLEEHHTPAVVSGTPQPFTVASLPGVTFTLLHSDSTPETGDCPYLINNASIVLMVAIANTRFLFTGDANGKERGAPSQAKPGHVEKKLLALNEKHPGILRADVLKVPYHGSETASTVAFIKAVDPRFAIVSASTRQKLPRESVLARCTKKERVVLRTDRQHKFNNDTSSADRSTEAWPAASHSRPVRGRINSRTTTPADEDRTNKAKQEMGSELDGSQEPEGVRRRSMSPVVFRSVKYWPTSLSRSASMSSSSHANPRWTGFRGRTPAIGRCSNEYTTR